MSVFKTLTKHSLELCFNFMYQASDVGFSALRFCSKGQRGQLCVNL